MKVSRISLLAILVLGVAFILGSQHVSAQGLADGTIVTFDHPVVIPGHVLPAGSYEFVQTGTTGNVVQVWDRQQGGMIASLITNSTEQSQYGDHMEFEFQPRESDNATELKAWYLGAGLFGHEFIYGHKNAPRESE